MNDRSCLKVLRPLFNGVYLLTHVVLCRSDPAAVTHSAAAQKNKEQKQNQDQ